MGCLRGANSLGKSKGQHTGGVNMTSLIEKGPNNYYTAQTNKLLRDFDKMAKRYRKVFVSHLGGVECPMILSERLAKNFNASSLKYSMSVARRTALRE